jgi:hypothetical protein
MWSGDSVKTKAPRWRMKLPNGLCDFLATLTPNSRPSHLCDSLPHKTLPFCEIHPPFSCPPLASLEHGQKIYQAQATALDASRGRGDQRTLHAAGNAGLYEIELNRRYVLCNSPFLRSTRSPRCFALLRLWEEHPTRTSRVCTTRQGRRGSSRG